MARLLHRVLSVLAWTTVVLLAAFGLYFSFANYPALAIAVTAAIAILLAYVERNLRRRQREVDDARRRARARVDVP